MIVRSSANVESGADSKFSTILHGIWLLLGLAVIPSVLNLIPLSALAAILIATGYKLAKPELFIQRWKQGFTQFAPFVITVAAILFVLGIFGIFLNRKNVIVILMSVELILLSVNLNLVAFSAHLNDLAGQVFTMFILTVAAAEAAIGLAILVVYFRNRGSIEVEDISTLKG